MAVFATTNELKTETCQALVERWTNPTTGSLYLFVSKGNPYSGNDTLPDPLPVTETAKAIDIINPLFFKKVNLSGANSEVRYVVPDPNGTITLYSQRYREVAAANIYDEGVRHIFIEVEIPANDILLSDTVRGFNLISNLRTTAGTLATGDSYLASEINLGDSTGNRLIYLENKAKYERIQSEAGELVRIIFAV
jgi:hypothetical protein